MNNFIFFGGKAIGNYILKKLMSSGKIPKAVICYRDIINEDILDEARRNDVLIYKIDKFKAEADEIFNFIEKIRPNYYISVAFPFILPEKILNLVKWPINIHTGAIPKYRGHHPLSAAFLNNENYQATTVHLMAPKVDAGNVLLQDFVQVKNEDTIVSVREKLIMLSYQLLIVVICQLENNCLHPKQQIGEVVWAPKRTPEDSLINFNKNSRYLHNFIRSLVSPYPNAFIKRNGETVYFKRSISSNVPGKVLKRISETEYIISTKDGIIWVETETLLNEGEILI